MDIASWWPAGHPSDQHHIVPVTPGTSRRRLITVVCSGIRSDRLQRHREARDAEGDDPLPPPNFTVPHGEPLHVTGVATGTGGAEPVLVSAVDIHVEGGAPVAATLTIVPTSRCRP